MKTRYKVLLGFGVVVVALAIAVVALTTPSAAPASCDEKLDLSQVRALADSLPGERPREIRFEQIARFDMPSRMMYGGAPFTMSSAQVFAYQLVYPDRTIVLDTAMNAEQAKAAMGKDYDPAAWQRLTAGLANAAGVYVTHEHADHLGGALAGGPPPQHLYLTPEQLASDRSKPLVIDEAARKAIATLDYQSMKAIAPGVVAIKAAGHTPGSQWFYVRTAGGAELLFVGDTAWKMVNVELSQGPPVLTSLVLKNDRVANACQLSELHALGTREPSVFVVPGHDLTRIEELVGRGLLIKGFQ